MTRASCETAARKIIALFIEGIVFEPEGWLRDESQASLSRERQKVLWSLCAVRDLKFYADGMKKMCFGRAVEDIFLSRADNMVK